MKLGFFGHLEGVNMDEFLDFVKTAAESLKLNDNTISNRCKWWNRGYCNGKYPGLLTIVDLVDYATPKSWLTSKFWSIDF